jgi:hypothetical protein
MSKSTDPADGRAQDYEALIKPGDAVETPDGALWVVSEVAGSELHLTSAWRGRDGVIYAGFYEPTRTVVPAEFVKKVADARRVRH